MIIKDHTRIDLAQGGTRFKQGDFVELAFTPRDAAGKVVDLTGKQIEASIWNRSKGVIYQGAASFDSAEKLIRVTIKETLDHGKFQIEFTVTDSTDADYRRKFPSDEYNGVINITPSTDNMDVVGVQMTTVTQLRNEQTQLQQEFASQVLPRVDTVEGKQTQLETQFTDVVSGVTDDAEILSARTGPDGTYPTIGARLDATNTQLAETEKKPNPKDTLVTLLATAETGSLSSAYTFQKYNNLKHSIISSNIERSAAWLKSTSNNHTLSLRLPMAVLIGDSIAEGHPALHGRLHPNAVNTYDSAYANQPGQLAYELGMLTGTYIYNHGIGGQTTAQVWARWRRDVLAETFSVGDSRGDKTLDEKPRFVFVNVAVNDVSTGVDEEVTKANLINMAKSARDNNIIAIFNGIPPNNIDTADMIAKKIRINDFLREEFPKYGATFIDIYEWGEDPLNAGKVNPLYYADGVHPNTPGYKDLARYMINQCVGLPIFLTGLVLESVVDLINVPSSLARATSVNYSSGTVSGVATLGDREQAVISLSLKGETTKIDLNPTEFTAITGMNYGGFSKVKAILSTQPAQKVSVVSNTGIKKKTYIKKTANQVLPTSTWTTVDFDLEAVDTLNAYSSANPQRITIPEVGEYLIYLNVKFDPNATGVRGVRIKKNGTNVICKNTFGNLGTMYVDIPLMYNAAFQTGDYLTVEVYQNSGGDLAMPALYNANEETPVFSIVLL